MRARPERRRFAHPLVLAALALAALVAAAPHAASAADAPAGGAPVVDSLLILSTTDVDGKTEPCGCKVPKGGFARRAAFADSLRRLYPNLLIVDNGGFFPDQADYEPNALFMLDAMGVVGVQVAALGDRELRFGRGFLLAALARARFPVVCANLWDLTTKKRVARPWTVVNVGARKVGVFGLMSKAFGDPRAGDSLGVGEPADAARSAVAALRKEGVALVVLLSNLGKTETEDLVASVPGIDVAVAGHRVPVIDQGRRVGSTTIVYGGDQAHYIGRTRVGFDAAGRPVEAKALAVPLSPDVSDHAAVAEMVRAFEASFNDRLHRLQNERAAKGLAPAPVDTIGTP